MLLCAARGLLVSLLVLSFGTGCGSHLNDHMFETVGGLPERKYISPKLAPLLADFIEDAGEHGAADRLRPLDVLEYGQIGEPGVIGRCWVLSYGGKQWRRVVVEPGLDYSTHLVLIYHELGHCMLGLKHTKAPNKIMNPYIKPELSATSTVWEDALYSLFNQ